MKPATCHPDRPYHRNDLCCACYFRERRVTLRRMGRVETRSDRIARRLREYVG